MYKVLMDRIAKVIEKIIGVVFLAMLIMVTSEVFARYVLHNSIQFSYELAGYFVIWLTFLGSSMGIRRAELVSIEFVKNKLSKGVAKIVLVAGLTLIASFLGICIWGGYNILSTVRTQTSPGLGISMDIPYAVVPIGSFLILLFVIEGIVNAIRSE
jgi:TRAP-type C4-dicarboxylate transport system permease small subunit